MKPGEFSHHQVESLEDQLVRIPAGAVTLRNHRKNEIRSVPVASFLIGRFPVTQGLYAGVMQRNASAFLGENLPVENVSWFDAIEFCNRLSSLANLRPCYSLREQGVEFDPSANGYRLPSEAEWEHACRADTRAVVYGELDKIAWYAGNSENRSHEVGQKEPNSWGLYDMLGNVWEWCADLYDPEVYGEYRVFRGGGWSDPERGCLASNRRKSHPTYKIDDLGFRLARSIQG